MSDVPFANRVRITDVSPRDGLQNEPGVIATADKAKLVNLLCRAGVDEVEVTSFVSAKWVPQLGDAAEVLALLPPSPREGAGGRVSKSKRVPNPLDHRTPVVIQRPTARYNSPPRQAETTRKAQLLRKQMTGPEWSLWSELSSRHLGGFRFRKQHPFGPFILDFFCSELGLCIELDGRTNEGDAAIARDSQRTRFLTDHGLWVVRFTNDQVISERDAVAATILQICRDLYANGETNFTSAVSPLSARQQPIANPSPSPFPLGRGANPPLFSVLVPNEKGMAAALASIDAGSRIDKVSVFTAASETFNRKNTNASITESIERFAPVIDQAVARDLPVRGYISCIIACPFDGPIAPAKVAEVARLLVNIGVDEIDLGDTIGAATPETTVAMLDAVLAEIGEGWLDPETFTLHLHDTFGRAASCARAALDRGVRSFDGSVAGLGGCPYASTPGKRAPGNISTETLIRTIRDAGLHPGLTGEIDDAALAQAAAFARTLVLPKV